MPLNGMATESESARRPEKNDRTDSGYDRRRTETRPVRVTSPHDARENVPLVAAQQAAEEQHLKIARVSRVLAEFSASRL